MRNLGVILDFFHFFMIPQHPFISKFWFITYIPWTHALQPSHIGCQVVIQSGTTSKLAWLPLAPLPFQAILFSVTMKSKSEPAPSLMKHVIDLPLPTEQRTKFLRGSPGSMWSARHPPIVSPLPNPSSYICFQPNLTFQVAATLNWMQFLPRNNAASISGHCLFWDFCSLALFPKCVGSLLLFPIFPDFFHYLKFR